MHPFAWGPDPNPESQSEGAFAAATHGAVMGNCHSFCELGGYLNSGTLACIPHSSHSQRKPLANSTTFMGRSQLGHFMARFLLGQNCLTK